MRSTRSLGRLPDRVFLQTGLRARGPTMSRAYGPAGVVWAPIGSPPRARMRGQKPSAIQTWSMKALSRVSHLTLTRSVGSPNKRASPTSRIAKRYEIARDRQYSDPLGDKSWKLVRPVTGEFGWSPSRIAGAVLAPGNLRDRPAEKRPLARVSSFGYYRPTSSTFSPRARSRHDVSSQFHPPISRPTAGETAVPYKPRKQSRTPLNIRFAEGRRWAPAARANSLSIPHPSSTSALPSPGVGYRADRITDQEGARAEAGAGGISPTVEGELILDGAELGAWVIRHLSDSLSTAAFASPSAPDGRIAPPGLGSALYP